MRRNQWVAIATGLGVVLVAVIIVLAFTVDNRQPERTAVVVGEDQQAERANEPARPAETGAGQQPSGEQKTTESGTKQKPAPGTEVEVDQQQKQTEKPQKQEQAAKASEQQKQQKSASTSNQNVKQKLNTITSGKNDKPAMVEFGAEWCPPCKKMKPIVEDLEKSYSDQIDIVYVDVDKYPQLAQDYNITAIPVQIFYNKQGKQVERHEGFYPKEDIVKQLQQMGVKK